MANPTKSNQIVIEGAKALDRVARGDTKEKLESTTQKLFNLFLNGGSISNPIFCSDYAGEMIDNIRCYASLISGRKEVDIAGGHRHVSTEEEAYDSLVHTSVLLKDLVAPFFSHRNDFTNRLFKDVYNLGFSYVDAIVNGIAEEYIDVDDALDAKLNSIELAKHCVRTSGFYNHGEGLDEATKAYALDLNQKLNVTRRDFMRSFALVPTARKKIIRGRTLTKKLAEEITSSEGEGQFDFFPFAIFPIAHGGTELAVAISNAYEDKGADPLVYPLLYSIKTRKQKYPWIQNDSEFLGGPLEGKKLLVVEDWVTTGNTLRGILNQLENTFPKETRVATVKRDPEKSLVPILDKYHFYVGEHSRYMGSKTDSLGNI